MVRIDLNTLQERHESVIQRTVDLEETLLCAEEEVSAEERCKGEVAKADRLLRMRLM